MPQKNEDDLGGARHARTDILGKEFHERSLSGILKIVLELV